MKLSTLIAIAALFVSSHVFALDTITDARQPSGQDIALAEQDAGSGFICIQSGGGAFYICQQKDTENNSNNEVVINRPSVACNTQKIAQSVASTGISKL